MNNNSLITWNNDIKLALSDVDETIAEVYTPAEPEMIDELTGFLRGDGNFFGNGRKSKTGTDRHYRPTSRYTTARHIDKSM